MKVCRVSEMRKMDQTAIEQYGIIETILMENAGNASFFQIQQNIRVQNQHFVVFCGIGNNGGDGLVIARKLLSANAKVTVCILGDRNKFKGTAKLNFDIAQKLKIQFVELDAPDQAEEAITNADAIVDAIFGTGLDREVSDLYAEVIEMINNSQMPVFSVDIPSGINGETGQLMSTAVKANFTTTYGQPKIGNLLYPGFEHGGKLAVSHISFPPQLHSSPDAKIETNEPVYLPARKSDGHKGSFGKALFIAGSSQYLGAPYFAALSYLKAGGGLSFLAAPDSISSHIASKANELVIRPQKSTPSGSLAGENKNQLLNLANESDFVVIGPGLSLDGETQQLVTDIIVKIEKPLLIDGDGITAVSKKPELLSERKAATILTPHPGEMARLTQKSNNEIEKNKINILQETTNRLGCTIVLKGAHSQIGFPDGRIFINLTGNSGMGTAGSGDVLTGIIAAMTGIGFDIEQAVRMGVFTHGLAGDIAADEIGQDGMTANDILESIPEAMYRLRNEFLVVKKRLDNKISFI